MRPQKRDSSIYLTASSFSISYILDNLSFGEPFLNQDDNPRYLPHKAPTRPYARAVQRTLVSIFSPSKLKYKVTLVTFFVLSQG